MLIRKSGFAAFITTNSIKDGGVREDGLELAISRGSEIVMAIRGIKWPGTANLVVSLISLARAESKVQRILDGRPVEYISALLEDTNDVGFPSRIVEQFQKGFIGSVLYADGLLITHEHASKLYESDPINHDVVFPIINGEEANSSPVQSPGRSVICFRNWAEDQAQKYVLPYEHLALHSKPERYLRYGTKEGASNQRLAERWWLFGRYSTELYEGIRTKSRCIAAAITTKHLAFSAFPTNLIFTNAMFVVATDWWEHFSILQSNLHESWARKYSGALETRLRYSPSDCFETFPFPLGLWQTANPNLATLGERYHEHRRALMKRLWLGLTDIYNLFHIRDLTVAEVARVSKKPLPEAEAGYQGLLELRRLHRELDLAVRDAYGWTDLDLGHDFVEVETLPENDRVRYTISPAARKEVLKRLLAENHKRAAAQVEEAATKPTAKRGRKAKVIDDAHGDLFA